MSRANGTIKFIDGYEIYCLYNGTVDYMFSACYPKQEMAWDMYYTRCHSRCTCRGDYRPEKWEEVIVTTDYGGGISWEGLACRTCMTFEGPFEPYTYEE